MTSLHDRLVALGDEGVDDRTRDTPHELWRRGVRYHRRRRVGTVVIGVVTVVAVAAIGLVGASKGRAEVRPAGPGDTTVGIPDRLYAASKWLPGTDDDGSPGQLAVVMPTSRGDWSSTGSHAGLVGVSAATGSYRFLDLPDAAESALGDAVLSPDGHRVAYWTTGATTGSPIADDTDPVTGVATYDTITGAVDRIAIPTQHGLYAQTLAWVDDDHLVLETGQRRTENFSRLSPTTTWVPGQDRLEEVPGLGAADSIESADQGRILATTRHGLRVVPVTPGGPTPEAFTRVPQRFTAAMIDPTGRRVAYVRGSRSPGPVAVAELTGDGRRSVSVLPGASLQVVGWSDDYEVVTVQQSASNPSDPSQLPTLELVAVDVHGGTSRLITTGDQIGEGASFATDLFARPSVPAVEPPHPLDPQAVGAGVVGIVLAGGVLLVVWRRRVRP